VHDPESAPLPSTVNPHPGPRPPPTPVDSVIMNRKGRRAMEDDDTEDEEEEEMEEVKTSKKPVTKAAAPQAIGGIPNEALLPAAIGVLAIVIVGVFAFGRSTAK